MQFRNTVQGSLTIMWPADAEEPNHARKPKFLVRAPFFNLTDVNDEAKPSHRALPGITDRSERYDELVTRAERKRSN